MKRIVTLIVALALLAPASALASSSACQAYNPQVPCTVHGPSSATLPFTGIDVALLAIGGGGLLGVGLVVRRLSGRLD